MGRASLLAGTLPLFALLVACTDDSNAASSLDVAVQLADPDPRFEVSASNPVREDESGEVLFVHEVRVRWQGEEPVILEDARFTLDAAGEDGGHLVLAGRGCGAEWSEERETVDYMCTADLQVIELRPDEAHAYPVRVYAELGPLRLEPGRYEVEQAVNWWFASASPYSAPGAEPEGTLRLRLTYEAR